MFSKETRISCRGEEEEEEEYVDSREVVLVI